MCKVSDYDDAYLQSRDSIISINNESSFCELSCFSSCGSSFRARDGPDMSADSERIFHRSLDLLHFWITDCKSVDFTPKSKLTLVLENFLNTEVRDVCGSTQALVAGASSMVHVLFISKQTVGFEMTLTINV